MIKFLVGGKCKKVETLRVNFVLNYCNPYQIIILYMIITNMVDLRLITLLFVAFGSEPFKYSSGVLYEDWGKDIVL